MSPTAPPVAVTPAITPAVPAPGVLGAVTRPLSVTLGVLALVAALLPLGVAVFLLFNVNAETVRADARSLHTAVAQDVARAIDEHFDDVRGDLGAVAAALVDRSLAGPDRAAVATALVSASRLLDTVAVYGKDGSRLDTIRDAGATTPDDAIAQTLSPALLKRAAAGFVIDDVIVGDGPVGTVPPRMLVASPIMVDGQVTGTVTGLVPLGALQGLVERLSQVSLPGYADAIVVVDGRRRFVAHTTAAKAFALDDASAEPLIAGVSLATDRPPKANFILQSDGTRGDGTEVVGTTISLAGAGSGFVVGVQMPTRVVFASLTRMRQLAGVVVLAAIVLAIGGAVVVARSITRPVTSLMQSAEALAHRRFTEVVPLGGRHDELGVLSGALANAAVALKDGEEALLKETRLREGLGRYLPSQLVDAWVASKADDLLVGKRTEITVLFADIVGFTPLSAQLSPEQMCALLNDLFTILTEIVFKHGGTVDKFIGDSVMAFWGAPLKDDKHAEHAVEAARDMVRFLDMGNLRWKKRFGVEIQLAVGINTGVAVVGNLGSEKRLVYTAIGEPVNIAARLESVAGPMQILASRVTVEAAGELGSAIALGPQDLTGVAQPVDVFALEV